MNLNNLNTDEDFSKLNKLLSNSLTQEERKKKYADKEKAKQKHLLDLNRDKTRKQAILEQSLEDIAKTKEKIIVWEFVLAISHHVMQVCSSCGNSREYHSGYYNIERNLKNELKRLQHTNRKPVSYKIFYTQSKSLSCINCENVEYMLGNEEKKEFKNLLNELEYKVGE